MEDVLHVVNGKSGTLKQIIVSAAPMTLLYSGTETAMLAQLKLTMIKKLIDVLLVPKT